MDRIMEVENEEEKSISITPSSVRTNLFARFENSEDSGFYSATPGSREQSYKAPDECSFNKSNDDCFMTPSSGTPFGVQTTPNETDIKNYLYETRAQSSCLREADHGKMMAVCCSPIVGVSDLSHGNKEESGHDKTLYMECEESFYDDNIARKNLFFTPVSNNELRKTTSDIGDIRTLTGSAVDVESMLHDDIIKPLIPVTPPKSNSPVRRGSQYSKNLSKRKCLYGFEYIDFLYFLGQKNSYPHIITKLLSYLSINDLVNVMAVSKTWQQICFNDLSARKKLHQHKVMCSALKENINAEHMGRRRICNPFSNIQNLQKSEKPVSTNSNLSPRTQRFKLFCREGEKLDNKSRLMPCPRCTLPARCSTPGSNNLGQCLCKNCQYRFCTACLKDFHNNTRCYRISSCPSRRPSNSRQSMVIGSKASKRRLSRT